MPRTARAIVAGHCYHVINRGNNKAEHFHERADYARFLWLMAEATDGVDLPVVAACLMPNHVHLVVQPRGRTDLARWTGRLFAAYARCYHKKYGTTGRIWQGRYKAFPSQNDRHLLTVLRYVERNAMTANLTDRAENWEWSSLNWRLRSQSPVRLEPSPVALPDDWVKLVNTPLTDKDLEAVRNAVHRQCPFGEPDWVAQRVKEFGLEQTVTPIGRPRKNCDD